MTTGTVDADFLSARNTLTQRTFGPECAGTVALDVSRMKDGDCAGLGLLQKRFGFVGVKMEDSARSLVMADADSNSPEEIQSIPPSQKVVFLKVECDFNKRADRAWFYYSLDGRKWTAIGKPLRMVYTLPHFMGYRFALFNYATKSVGGSVDFDYFRVSPKINRAN